MKFKLQPGETLYIDYLGQRREGKNVGDLFRNKTENGHIYITSSRVVFTTTQGLLRLVNYITDFLPALQDIEVEIMISNIVGLKMEKVMMFDCVGIQCNDGKEYIFYAGNGLNNKSSEMLQYVADACQKQGITLAIG